MGQKVCPIGIRLGVSKDWNSNWYANRKDFPEYLGKDIALRQYLIKKYKAAQISRIHIERLAKSARVTVHSARPGVMIGKTGADAEKLRRMTSKLLGVDSHVKVMEVRKPDLDAKLVAESIAQQLEKRVPFRRAMKRAVTSAMRGGAEGIRVCVSGRLGGAEIARSERYLEGRVPLHTFRADIDYATADAHTTYGVIGVKIWIFKGEKFRTKGGGMRTERSERAQRAEKNSERAGKSGRSRAGKAKREAAEAKKAKPEVTVKTKSDKNDNTSSAEE